jgi:hypothetical protein
MIYVAVISDAPSGLDRLAAIRVSPNAGFASEASHVENGVGLAAPDVRGLRERTVFAATQYRPSNFRRSATSRPGDGQ